MNQQYKHETEIGSESLNSVEYYVNTILLEDTLLFFIGNVNKL